MALAALSATLGWCGGIRVAAESLRDQILRQNAAYQQGDRAFVADLFHDQIDWRFFISSEALPMPGQVRGKWHVLLALQKIHEHIEIIRNEITLLIVEGERAAMICDRVVRQRQTGRVMQYKVAAFHRYEGGKLIEYQEFGDGLDILEQALGRGIDAPAAYR